MTGDVVFVTGGARSGKSAFALKYALSFEKRVFLATAEPFDHEMQDRIDRHRLERGEGFVTVEEPLYLDRAIGNLPAGIDVVLVDCLTVWAGNLMHRFESDGEEEIDRRIGALLDTLRKPPCTLILVSNEVGMGIVPENAMARKLRDIAGSVNQKVAALSSQAWLLCSGLPLRLK